MVVNNLVKSFVCCFLLLACSHFAIAQKSKVASADKKYDAYAYIEATKVYEKLAAKGFKDEKMFQVLGNSYYFNGKLEQAEKWYSELFKLRPNQAPELYYRYAQSLKAAKKYNEADVILKKFYTKSGKEQRAKLIKTQPNYLDEIEKVSGRYNIKEASVNSVNSDYGTSFFQNNIVFTSARDTSSSLKKNAKWTNQPYTALYMADILSDSTQGKPERFSKKIDSKFNESTPVFTSDGSVMYFTRNNYNSGKKGKSSKREVLLKLYRASNIMGKWGSVTELPFNSDEYSVAHPALSQDNKTLYFASDMPGTLGQSDLFKVAINNDGSFGKPTNLGKNINTEGRESFPFVSDNNELYFASDGRPGLGGLDVFVAKIEDNNSIEQVKNVGKPINSNLDDFCLIITKDRKGFFSTNRDGGTGDDDIYQFIEKKRMPFKQLISGTIVDSQNNQTINEATVSLFDADFNLISEQKTTNGSYRFEAESDQKYYVRVSSSGFETIEIPVDVNPANNKTELNFSIIKTKQPIAIGTDLAKTLEIPMVYFDLDQYKIREDASFELQKLVEVMKQFPEMKIAIKSHTDSRQTAKYNMTLSENRANATLAWLVKNGINKNRLTAKGFGESKLVNHCKDGVQCSEAEHQANRRSEFVIVSMK